MDEHKKHTNIRAIEVEGAKQLAERKTRDRLQRTISSINTVALTKEHYKVIENRLLLGNCLEKLSKFGTLKILSLCLGVIGCCAIGSDTVYTGKPSAN